MTDKPPTTKEGWDEYIRKNRERKAKEEQDRKERVEKDTARRGWVADGGDEASFEKTWPSMRDEARGERVLEAGREAGRRAREEQSRQIHSAF